MKGWESDTMVILIVEYVPSNIIDLFRVAKVKDKVLK